MFPILTTSSSRRGGLVAVLFASVVLGACVPTLSTEETRFYVLGTLPADTAPIDGVRRQPPLTVDLATVDIPQYLQRPEIVTRASENQLVLAAFDNWGGSLEKNIMRVLAGNLALLLDTPEIHIAARRPPAATDARLEVEVMQFERGPDGRVRLTAQWRLSGVDRDRTPIMSRVTKLASEPLPAAALETTVATMSALLGEFSRELASAINDSATRPSR